jgi:hypothetical protein
LFPFSQGVGNCIIATCESVTAPLHQCQSLQQARQHCISVRQHCSDRTRVSHGTAVTASHGSESWIAHVPRTQHHAPPSSRSRPAAARTAPRPTPRARSESDDSEARIRLDNSRCLLGPCKEALSESFPMKHPSPRASRVTTCPLCTLAPSAGVAQRPSGRTATPCGTAAATPGPRAAAPSRLGASALALPGRR